MQRIAGTAFLNNVILTVNDIVPGTAMPMVIAGKHENPSSLNIESNVEIIGKLVKKVRCIGAFVAPARS